MHAHTCLASHPGPQQSQDRCSKPGPEVEAPLPRSFPTPAYLRRAQRRALRSFIPKGGSTALGLQGAGGSRRPENPRGEGAFRGLECKARSPALSRLGYGSADRPTDSSELQAR